MSSSLKDKVKALVINSNNNNPKKQIENIIAFIFILIVTIIIINFIINGDKDKNKLNDDKNIIDESDNISLAKENNNNSSDQDDLEKKLEVILNKISGVGKVSVLITYSQSSEVVAMYNENSKNTTAEETDSNGGKRVTSSLDTSKEVICTDDNGKNSPVTQKVIKPKIEGAVIIAEGATNATIKTNIIQAVEAATGLSTYKIQVFEMKSDN